MGQKMTKGKEKKKENIYIKK